MEPRITIITLGVADLPQAVRFYRDGLGWPTTYEDGHGDYFSDPDGYYWEVAWNPVAPPGGDGSMKVGT